MDFFQSPSTIYTKINPLPPVPKADDKPHRRYPRRLTEKRMKLVRRFIKESHPNYVLAQVETPEWQDALLEHIDPRAKARGDLILSDVAKWVKDSYSVFKQAFEEAARVDQGVEIQSQSQGYVRYMPLTSPISSTSSSQESGVVLSQNDPYPTLRKALVPYVNLQECTTSGVAKKEVPALPPCPPDQPQFRAPAEVPALPPCAPPPNQQSGRGTAIEAVTDVLVLGSSLEDSLVKMASDTNYLPATENSLKVAVDIFHAVLENCKKAGAIQGDRLISYDSLGALLRLQGASTTPIFTLGPAPYQLPEQMEIENISDGEQNDQAQA